MTHMLDTKLSELRETMEMYKLAAERRGRASESCCLSLALESLERCRRLVQLAINTSPPEEVVREQAEGEGPALACAWPRADPE